MHENSDYTLVDARGLPPPEPLELVLEAISILPRGQTIKMLIDREPRPLYDILYNNGMLYNTHITEDTRYEILIWHAK